MKLLTLSMVQDPKTRRQRLHHGSLFIFRSCFLLLMATTKTKVPFFFLPSFGVLVSTVVIDNGFLEVPSEKGVDTKSTGSCIGREELNINVVIEKDRPRFPKWYLNVFAWLFLCVIIAFSVLSTSPPQPLLFILPHLELPSMSSLWLPSASILLILPTFVVLLLVVMAMRSRYSPIYHKEKGSFFFFLLLLLYPSVQCLKIKAF